MDDGSTIGCPPATQNHAAGRDSDRAIDAIVAGFECDDAAKAAGSGSSQGNFVDGRLNLRRVVAL